MVDSVISPKLKVVVTKLEAGPPFNWPRAWLGKTKYGQGTNLTLAQQQRVVYSDTLAKTAGTE